MKVANVPGKRNWRNIDGVLENYKENCLEWNMSFRKFEALEKRRQAVDLTARLLPDMILLTIFERILPDYSSPEGTTDDELIALCQIQFPQTT